ncbi:MAG: TolC family protein, partial [Bryobacteraceae bacterium]
MTRLRHFSCGVTWMACAGAAAYAQQTALTWQQVKDRFEAGNPTLRAGLLNIQESKSQEITAYLRPNPNLNFGLDQIDPIDTSP